MSANSTTPSSSSLSSDREQAMRAASVKLKTLSEGIKKFVIGQDEVVQLGLATFFASGHLSLKGPPGAGKTFFANTLANGLGLEFKRIQGSPDLMPGDITGSVARDLQSGEFKLVKGPIFTEVLLVDEDNRMNPKAAAALFEGAQEKQVSLNGETTRLSDVFFMVATQNPGDHEGTYPQPEALKDRYLSCLEVDYPDKATELRIATARLSSRKDKLEAILNLSDCLEIRDMVDDVVIGDDLANKCVELVRQMRPSTGQVSEQIKNEIRREPGTRAATSLIRLSKALALTEGRLVVNPDDIKRCAMAVLRHRVEVSGMGKEKETMHAIVDTAMKSVGLTPR